MKTLLLSCLVACLTIFSCQTKPDTYVLTPATLADTNTTYIVYCQYPIIEHSNDDIAQTINNSIEKFVKSKTEEFKKNATDWCNRGDFQYDRPSVIEITYTAVSTTDTILSIRFNTFIRWAGPAFGSTYFDTYNFDFHRKQEITINDIVKQYFAGNDSAAVATLTNLNRKTLGSTTFWFDGFWRLPKTLDVYKAMNIRNDTLVFIYDDYIMEDYGCGGLSVEIPLSSFRR